MKKKYHTIGTIPKSNIKIVERGKIDIPDTQIHENLFLLTTQEEKDIKKEEEAAEKQKAKGDKKGSSSAKKSENGGSKIPGPKKGKYLLYYIVTNT